MVFFPKSLQHKIEQVKEKHQFRSLKTNYPSIDFSSNDYLGFSSQGYLLEELKTLGSSIKTGSTGSRLISGNSFLFNEIENEIAQFHHGESALIYNSGYDANLGLLSSVPQKGDLILSDELIHASLIDGIRLSFATHYKFKHNDINSLKELITRHQSTFKEIYVVVESVYSMDGDCSPLVELADFCKRVNAHLIVDEAHAIGVFGKNGKGLCDELNIEQLCFARIYTYGKAMGCHGASIVGSEELKHYLINFSRSFIYTTAMPEHSLLSIKAAYQLLKKTIEVEKLRSHITFFNTLMTKSHQNFIASTSAIHCLILKGNNDVHFLEEKLGKRNFFVKSIKSPTVKQGEERMRLCLHSFNTKDEIDELLSLIRE
jgi:8-amino-7-oxononanoate synthase